MRIAEPGLGDLKSYIEALAPSTSEGDCLGHRSFPEVIKTK